MKPNRAARVHRSDAIDPGRRELLLSAGLAAAAAALPLRALSADAPGPMMAKLSAYMGDAAGRALPEEVVEKAKHHILDTFAAMVSGAELLPAKAAFNYAKDVGGDRTATASRRG